MVDIPGNNTTTATISVGGSKGDTLEASGDHDWFKITLAQGQAVTVSLNGVTLEDPYLRIRDAGGHVIYENDDIHLGVDFDSLISFAAPSSGTYYIDVGSYEDAETPGGTGSYQLSVSAYQAPPVWTNNQIANQLTEGYWGDGIHRFVFGDQPRQLTVNITGLTANGQFLAHQALQTWSDITGISFVESSSPTAQIMFTDDDPDGGAFTESNYSGADITSSHVNVDMDWLNIYGSDVGSYSFQAYIHEIGHALGLGHAGNYNTTAEYPYDALYANDAFNTSVMSYFSQTDSTYFRNQGFTDAFDVTPMVADILAIQQVYGSTSNARSGNTTYGFNANAGILFDATQTTNVAYTIFDTGGVDTLDYSGYLVAQLIDLTPEAFSNIGGEVGNVSIARGTIIENATGGSGADVIAGNGANNILRGGAGADTLKGRNGNDVLIGDGGNDVLIGGDGNDTYYVDSAGDQALESAGRGSDIVMASASYTLNGTSEVEELRAVNLASTDPLKLFGNDFAQTIRGNAGNNSIKGLGGNDILIGGGGEDLMLGGAGHDTYYVDSAGDRAVESVGRGVDTVLSSVSFTLEGGFEIEILRASNGAGTDPIKLFGNDFGQQIIGNAGNNSIKGLGGNDLLIGGGGEDLMLGGAGNDTYRVDSLGDRALESAGRGSDTVLSSISFTLEAGSEIENLSAINAASTAAMSLFGNEFGQIITGNAGANVLRGFAGDDHLIGGDGNDRLDGGTGNNVLTGGTGVDRFVFAYLGVNDTITDFTKGEKIDLQDLDASTLLGGDQAFTWIGTNDFSNTAGQLRTWIQDGLHYVAGDVNGDGIADFVINVGSYNIGAADFIV